MDVIKLVERSYEINKANGWHAEKRDWEELCLLIVSEVAKALEDYRAGKAPNQEWYTNKKSEYGGLVQFTAEWKPCGIPSELADVLIRIADTVGIYEEGGSFDMFVGWVHDEGLYIKRNVHRDLSFAVNLNRIVREISFASADEGDFKSLAKAFYMTENLARICGIDIERAVNEKLAYNATRGHKHGGKVI